MEVLVNAPGIRASTCVFPAGSVVQHVLDRLAPLPQDFYVIRDGRRAHLDDPLQHGAVYHLEPRLRGGKGGFGSMLRALGAQIEKTTNREACRDLSGRRLRDVNHEKEMAEWLKKQAEREAEKEQRRLERLQRKLNEPKHQFSDTEYQQQCHDLSERLEDSVLKGLQASSSGQVKVDDVSGNKRAISDQTEEPAKKKSKKTGRRRRRRRGGSGERFWTGLEEMEELLSSEDDEAPSTSSSSSCRAAATVTMTTRREETEPEEGSSSSSDSQINRAPQYSEETSRNQTEGPSDDQDPPEISGNQSVQTSEVQDPPESSKNENPQEISREQTERPSEDQDPPGLSKPSESSEPSQQNLDLFSASSVQQLEALGLDVLKEELMSRGLKCGGTLSERAARLFAVRGLSPDQIDPALLAKPTKTKKK
ncbi:splicing regulator SDE2 [Archocentrus centrarchus]|uniref:splicing regulator SDE2 n=1 Tax=Archocentrus centrarchus TaxID=63155 RepID=UPI0011E9FF61|nr:replication stress response regulator SDE2 [Archocentrus centrarchus]